MAVRLKVKGLMSYQHNNSGDFECEDERGKRRLVDLRVAAKWPAGFDINSLIGKTVECDWLQPYLEIAENPRIVE